MMVHAISDSSPVVFIQHATKIQRRERWVPRKGAQGEMGREIIPCSPTSRACFSLCRVLYEEDWGRFRCNLALHRVSIPNCVTCKL